MLNRGRNVPPHLQFLQFVRSKLAVWRLLNSLDGFVKALALQHGASGTVVHKLQSGFFSFFREVKAFLFVGVFLENEFFLEVPIETLPWHVACDGSSCWRRGRAVD